MLELLSVTIQYFTSFRDPVTIEFNTEPGLYFLTGRNDIDLRISPNGAGKSSVFEAVQWCWTGKLSTGERAADVANSSKKRPTVTTVQRVDGELITICRQGNPNKLFLNNKEVEEATVESVIGRTRDQILQSVIFGQRSKLFYDLSIPQRGELLDDVFKLNFWQDCADLAKKDADEHGKEKYVVETRIARLHGQQEALRSEIEVATQKQQEWEAERTRRVEVIIAQIENKENIVTQDKEELASLEAEAAKLGTPTFDAELRELRGEIERQVGLKMTYDDQRRRTAGLRLFYESHDTCPTCFQNLSPDFVSSQKETLRCENAAAEDNLVGIERLLEAKRQRIDELESERTKFRVRLDTLNTDIVHIRANIRAETNNIETLSKQVEDLLASDPYSDQLELSNSKLQGIMRDVTDLQESVAAIEGKVAEAEFWKNGFKRVRLFRINKLVDTLSLEATSAAASLGLNGWRIIFTTETETKTGGVKSGVQIQIVAPEQTGDRRVWSGGEEQRVRLAVSLGLARVIQNSAGHRINFMALDEPTQFLSQFGVEDLVAELRAYAEMNQICVWLIDHRSLDFGGFKDVLQVIKDRSGSRVERMK